MSDPLTLASDFEPATHEDWLAEVRRVLLRGKPDATDADFERAFAQRLVHRTEDGLDIQPLYTQTPPIRPARVEAQPWEIRQRVWPEVAGSTAESELAAGATGVLLRMDDGTDLTSALDGVFLDLAPVSLDGATTEQAAGLIDLWQSRGVPVGDRRGSLGVDPLAEWARSGGAFDLSSRLDEVATLVGRAASQAPNARVITVDGTVWHDAGASDGQELAWTVASGVWFVRELAARGINATLAVQTLEFRFAATPEQFATIAKLRAARALWAQVMSTATFADPIPAMRIHAECSRAMLTRYDTWVNVLRSTVATFAGAVGGADAITVWPHDSCVTEGGSALGRRIARNTQSILQLESHLDQVADPAAGSWYVDSLTDGLARHTWSLVQESERAGGIAAMLESGVIAAAIEPIVEERERAIATRRQPITGLSEFPNIEEATPTAIPTPKVIGVRFAPLTLRRRGEGFEELRDRTAELTPTPTVFLATLGSPADYTARATYAKNFFEVAGIQTTLGPVADFASAGTDIACLCSSDARYVEYAPQAVAELRAAGARQVFLAGRGREVPGVDDEIGLGCDVLDILTRTLDSWEKAR